VGKENSFRKLKLMPDSLFELPSALPVPKDDGACSHLAGLQVPDIPLASTAGDSVNLARIRGRTVLFCYPRTGEPGRPVPHEWDEIPGARGCTPQCCGFRDSYSELKSAGADHVYGFSTQDTDYQREVASRLNLPYPLVSDRDLKLARALMLPTFEFNFMTLIKRLTLIIDEGRIRHVFYPVFPPDQSARQTLEWLTANPS
jgi:peroxiredoxin